MDKINVGEIIAGSQSEESVLAMNLYKVNWKDIGTFRVGNKDDGKIVLAIFPNNGNNLLIECENLEELKKIANKVILNANKKMVEGKQVLIETALEDKESKRVKLKGGMTAPFDKEYIKQIEKYEEEIDELNSGEDKDVDEEIEKLCKESDIQEKIREAREKGESSVIVVDATDIIMCGEKLENTRDVADYLIDKSNIGTNPNEKLIDLNKNNYDEYTQDILLSHIYNKEIKLTKEQASGIRDFKFTSVDINLLLRGKMKEIDEKVVLDIINMDKVFKSLPRTKQDIVVYRGGSSTNKSKDKGAKNEWESTISFTTNEAIAKQFSQGGVVYKAVLKAGSPAVPIDTLEKINWYNGTENELILPPLVYQVRDMQENQLKDGVDLDIDILEFKDLMLCLEESMKKYQAQTKEKLKEVEKSETKLKMIDSEQENKIFESLGYNEKDIQEEQLDIKYVIKQLEEKDVFKEFLERDSEIESDRLQYKSNLHGTNHTRRVAFFATILSNLGELDEKDKKVLMTAVQYHDIGRENDNEDKQHGASSVKKLEENSNRLEKFNKEDQELIKFMIEQHSKSKSENEEAIARLEDEKKERYQNLLNYMKDSDKLDRVRLGKYDGLDVSRLSLPTSKSLVKVAYQAHEYLFDIVNVKNKDTYLNNSAKIEECLDLIDKEKDKPIDNIEVKGLTYFDDEEKGIQNQEIIESKVEEKQEQNIENGLQKDVQQESKWMNRFKGWYGAIDRVSGKSKAYFVKMKSDIIKAISNKTRERENDKQVYKGEEL